MMKKIITTISLLLFGITIYAQQENQSCGTSVSSEMWENELQKLISGYKTKQKSQRQSSTVYTIPIIFHIIHSGQPIGTFPNISQGQINSQITVLNQDFSGNGFNSSNYPSNAFVNWVNTQSLPSANIDNNGRIKIADVGIQFCLATKDTLGNILPEPGIDRIDYNSKGWTNPNTFATQTTLANYLNGTIKPQSIWNVTKYLNVWVSDKNSALSYLGVATYPPLSGLTGLVGAGTDLTDGIWCYTKAIGSNNLYPSGIYGSPMVEGRTLTHEVGHYLGLRHIWGDGACVTDYCDDTPTAAAQNVGAPTYPLNVGSCSNPTNAPEGEMFMNFMDYPWDPYKYMFTTDQATRMQTAMLNSPYRYQLGTHGLCSAPLAINDLNLNDNISIYPNPAKTELNLNASQNDINELSISNLLGQVLIKSQNQNRIDISNLTNGIYILAITQGQNKYTKKFIKE
jgi:hypothetical protein